MMKEVGLVTYSCATALQDVKKKRAWQKQNIEYLKSALVMIKLPSSRMDDNAARYEEAVHVTGSLDHDDAVRNRE